MAKKSTPTKRTRFDAKKRVPAKRGLRSIPLPGLEQVRSQKLDNICESIADTREQMNTLRTEEKDEKRGALTTMREQNLTTYRHAGVELVRVPGEERLRVRTSKQDATAETIEKTPEPEPTDGRLAAAGE